ncbi:MAG: photosynthetic reaction center subunit L [Oscillochloris sp.]|nr:photosynthetic reaction center subunit L [Oscillochloris sp.]
MSGKAPKDPRFPDLSFTVLSGARSTRVTGGRTIEELEPEYKIKGRTTFSSLFKYDPFDFWVGPFYVGFWGFITVLSIIFGVYFYVTAVIINGPYSLPQNFFAGRIDPPPASIGLSMATPGQPGFTWQMTVFFATMAFVSWMMRQVDISMKLDMGYHVAVAYGVVVSAWITLQVLRPIAMGQWHEGFVLGVMPHLDWISNFGYRYKNFFYNPFHAIGITGLFTSTFLLGAHGSIILSAAQYRGTESGDVEDTFFRDVQYYSVGETGIHRLGFIAACGGVLSANMCILLSGWVVQDWVSFWNFWTTLPFWSGV